MKVVSLLPGATELVAALGCGDRLVGRSHECDYPAEVTHLPQVTRALVDAEAPSAAIDREVKERLSKALSLYEIDEGLLGKLEPDLIITQSQCDVCAVSFEEVERAAAKICGTGARVLDLAPNDLDDVLDNVLQVAGALAVPEAGRRLHASLVERLATIAYRTKASPARPKVACLEWLDPVMTAGNWVPTLVDLAGGEAVLATAGKHSPWASLEALYNADPDLIVLMPCGFPLARAVRESELLWSQEGWRALRAVRERQVFVTDGNQYFNRPGPRLVDSAQILAEILHPERGPARFDGTGWRRLESPPL